MIFRHNTNSYFLTSLLAIYLQAKKSILEMPKELSYYPEVEEDIAINDCNAHFYEEISIEIIKDLAIKGGLNTCCDVELVQEFINNSTSILEMGAGYGRVLQYLLSHDCKADITAVERSSHLCQKLLADYSERVSIHNIDIRNNDLKKKFDLILWLWSGISDFSFAEQKIMLKKLYLLLNENGIIILDTLECDQVPFKSEMISKKSCCLKIENNKFFGCIPGQEEIDEYAQNLNFKTIQHIKYETKTKRKRSLHIFMK